MRDLIPALAGTLLLAMTVSGYAAPYAKTVTVAKTAGDFTSPVNALASITGASASEPVLVKILPGTYDLGSASLQLKEYVDVEGGGIDETIITSTIVNVSGETCSAGTVNMARNSSLKRLTVVNNAQGEQLSGLTAGVVFDGVKATADSVRVSVGADSVATPGNAGVCSTGASGNAILNNVAIEVHNNGPAYAVYLITDGSAAITGAKLAAFSVKEASTHVINCTNGNKMTGTLALDQSQVEGTIQDEIGGNRGIDARECRATIANTTVKLSGGDDNVGVLVNKQPATIDKSKIFSPGKALTNEGPMSATISNSVVQGELPQQKRVTLRNNTDERGEPLADR